MAENPSAEDDWVPKIRKEVVTVVIAELVAACEAADVDDYRGEVVMFMDALLLYAETPGLSAGDAVARAYGIKS